MWLFNVLGQVLVPKFAKLYCDIYDSGMAYIAWASKTDFTRRAIFLFASVVRLPIPPVVIYIWDFL